MLNTAALFVDWDLIAGLVKHCKLTFIQALNSPNSQWKMLGFGQVAVIAAVVTFDPCRGNCQAACSYSIVDSLLIIILIRLFSFQCLDRNSVQMSMRIRFQRLKVSNILHHQQIYCFFWWVHYLFEFRKDNACFCHFCFPKDGKVSERKTVNFIETSFWDRIKSTKCFELFSSCSQSFHVIWDVVLVHEKVNYQEMLWN